MVTEKLIFRHLNVVTKTRFRPPPFTNLWHFWMWDGYAGSKTEPKTEADGYTYLITPLFQKFGTQSNLRKELVHGFEASLQLTKSFSRSFESGLATV
jgi:hypothetical protein